MLQEPFAIGNSFIHRLDPRIRIAAAVVFSFVTAVSKSFPALFAALAISVILVISADLSLREITKRLIIVNSFILLLWLVLPLTFRGTAAFAIGPLKVYMPGIDLSARITLKSNAILLALIALVSTMTFSTSGYALQKLHIPEKIVYLLLMTYRYVFVIEQEYQRLLRAVQIRGFRSKTSLHTYQTVAYMVGMLLVRSALRADRVYNAMRCRGFRRRFYCLQEFSSGRNEWLFAAAMAVAVAVLIYLEWPTNEALS